MKIVIPGGSGQVGTMLARALHPEHEVVVLSRAPQPRPWRTVAWDAATLGPWTREIDGAAVVISLAGRSVNCRYTESNKRSILDSRVQSTSAVAGAIAQAARPPTVWLQASTATIYSHRYDAPNDECTGLIGGSEPDAPPQWSYSIDVATAWERAATTVSLPATRVVLLRSAMTMSADRGGVFEHLALLARLGLGGRAGDGRQFVSWIHEQDFIEAVCWLIGHDDLAGPINLASPNPLPYAEFMSAIRRALHMPIGLPSPRWLLEFGAFVLRTETELVLKSRRVVPTRLLKSGFTFRYPEWPDAAAKLCAAARTDQA